MLDFGVIEGVLSPNDYGDVVTVVMDLSAFETEGASLRDAGARVRRVCVLRARKNPSIVASASIAHVVQMDSLW